MRDFCPWWGEQGNSVTATAHKRVSPHWANHPSEVPPRPRKFPQRTPPHRQLRPLPRGASRDIPPSGNHRHKSTSSPYMLHGLRPPLPATGDDLCTCDRRCKAQPKKACKSSTDFKKKLRGNESGEVIYEHLTCRLRNCRIASQLTDPRGRSRSSARRMDRDDGRHIPCGCKPRRMRTSARVACHRYPPRCPPSSTRWVW